MKVRETSQYWTYDHHLHIISIYLPYFLALTSGNYQAKLSSGYNFGIKAHIDIDFQLAVINMSFAGKVLTLLPLLT